MKYKIHLQWGNFKKYPPRIGEIPTENLSLIQILDNIFCKEQNETEQKASPSASSGDIIELEDGRKYLIEDLNYKRI